MPMHPVMRQKGDISTCPLTNLHATSFMGMEFTTQKNSIHGDRRYIINMSQFHLHYRFEPKEVKPWELDLWDIIIIHRVLIRIKVAADMVSR